MLTFQGRQIPETLAEIVHPGHTVVMVHDMQNDNTGKGGKYDQIGRRIDVTGIIPPIADFLPGYIGKTNLQLGQTYGLWFNGGDVPQGAFTPEGFVGLAVIEPTTSHADFDGNLAVDGRDFLAWQRGLGMPTAQPVHGDANGVTTIPLEIASRVAEACVPLVDAENILIDAARQGDVTLEKYRELTQSFRKAQDALAQGLSGQQADHKLGV